MLSETVVTSQTHMANELLKHTKGQPVKILLTLGLFTAVVSAFLDNVTTVILVMPITFAIAKDLKMPQCRWHYRSLGNKRLFNKILEHLITV